MQPTPLVLQWSPQPRRATSLSSASFTDWLWQERQPAATHTFTVCVNFACASCSVWAMCSSSSGVMGHPFCQVLFELRGCDLAGYFIVVHDGRSQTAGSEATCG